MIWTAMFLYWDYFTATLQDTVIQLHLKLFVFLVIKGSGQIFPVIAGISFML